MTDFNTAFNNELFDQEFSKSNQIDFFFTKRTTSYTREVIQQDLTRKDQKFTCTNNFIVLNLNFEKIKEKDIILVEIWGDRGYFYQGKICDNKGIFPLLSLKLKEDSQLFIKLTISQDDNQINYINFISIPKKYQNDMDDTEEMNV